MMYATSYYIETVMRPENVVDNTKNGKGVKNATITSKSETAAFATFIIM